MNQKIGQATKWSSITEIIAKLISPITNMILARLLVPEAFGIVATITMVISFAEIFTDAGFQKYIIQHEFADDEALDNSTNVAFWTNLGVSTFICIIIFFFRHQIADLVGSPGLGNSISIASVLIIVAAFSSIQIARYRRALDFKTLFYVRIITSLIPLVVTVPLAFILRNYWALLIGTFTSQLCNAIALTVRSKWKPKFYYSFTLFKEMFAFTAWTLLESISIWFTTNIGVFIVGNYLNDYYLGIYKTSMSTVNAYMAIITSALTPVLFSALSRYQNDDENFRRTYYQFQRLTAVLVIPMGIGIFLYRDLVTQILLGSQWGEASGFIGLWGLTSAITIVFSHFSSEVYRSKGNPKISLILQVVHIAFLVPTLILSASYGFEILYIARSLVRVQIIVCALSIMHIMYGFKVQHILHNVLPMIISALIMGVAGYLIQQISSSMIWQFVSVFICIIIYFTVLLGLFPSVRHEVLGSVAGKTIMRKIKRK
ncbi:MAG: lipopolysaccharide biosynthesis protein [Oscillospiraceae bacterium]|nr:lipopolysaccharide biosynthesis protein [Prevotella sp.]MBQ9167323.1 lipopolysaccharide biosynthesis protein [Oscillospiraceae bacterium]